MVPVSISELVSINHDYVYSGHVHDLAYQSQQLNIVIQRLIINLEVDQLLYQED